MIELAVRTRLLLDTVDAFILNMESPVNKRRRVNSWCNAASSRAY
jgi:hypothetical protein